MGVLFLIVIAVLCLAVWWFVGALRGSRGGAARWIALWISLIALLVFSPQPVPLWWKVLVNAAIYSLLAWPLWRGYQLLREGYRRRG